MTKEHIGEVLHLSPSSIKLIKREMRARGVNFGENIDNNVGDEVGVNAGGTSG